MIDLLRYAFLFSLVFGLWFFILRKKPYYSQKLHPRTWFREVTNQKWRARVLRIDRHCDVKTESWKKILKVFCLSMLVVGFLYFLLPVVNDFAEGLAGGTPSVEPGNNPVASMAGLSPYLLLVVAVSVPVIEEWLFRHVLLEELKIRWGIRVAIILSAGLFGLVHLTNVGFAPHAALVPFIAGLIFGIGYVRGGLKTAVFLHSGNNGLITILWILGF